MPHKLDISVTAPFSVGDLVARIGLADGTEMRIELRDGRYSGESVAQPVKLTLTTESPSGGSNGSVEVAALPQGIPIDVHTAFCQGIAIPADGVIVIRLVWGAPCHHEHSDGRGEGERFGSYEHTQCARLVGVDADGRPLQIDGIVVSVDGAVKLPVGASALSFGEIIALAGDFYAHLDDRAVREFEWAWPEAQGLSGWVAGDYRATTLAGDTAAGVAAILAVIDRNKDRHGLGREIRAAVVDGIFGKYPTRRYLALASQNFCHFGAQPDDGSLQDEHNEALRLYRAYHARALSEAAAAKNRANPHRGLLLALVTEAFGCHFLTDLFASGHIRVPRRLLAKRFGVVRGGLRMSAAMHEEDNELGLWCTGRLAAPNAARVVWRAYGDNVLLRPEAGLHLRQVEETVRRSVAEIVTVYALSLTRGLTLDQAVATIPQTERGEAMIPVPLPAGCCPGPRDVLPGSAPAPQFSPNSYPLYKVSSDGRIAERSGPPHENHYEVLS